MAESDHHARVMGVDDAEMAEGTRGFSLPTSFVLQGCKALLAFMKSTKYQSVLSCGKPDLLASGSNSKPIHLNFNLWVVPKKAYYPVKISNLPYDIHDGVSKRICLIVPNKEGKTPEETVEFFKTYVRSLNKVHDFDVITWQDLQSRLVSFEEKRNLVRSYDMFIADSTLQGFLIPKLGTVFKRSQKFPINIALHRATELKRVLTGTNFFLHNDGNNYSYLIGHSGMKSKELKDNIVESLSQLAKVVPNGWRNVRSAGIMGQGTAFIPIYDSSDVANFDELSQIYQKAIVKSVPVENADSIELKQPKEVGDVLHLKKGFKHLSKYSKVSELKEKVLKLSGGQRKASKKNQTLLKGVSKPAKKAGKDPENVDSASKDVKSIQEDSLFNASSEVEKAPRNEMSIDENALTKKLRSTSDVAVMKTEERKLKRSAADMSDVQLTGREIFMLTNSPQKKKSKPEQTSPCMTGYDKHIFEEETSKRESGQILSPKLSGYEKHLFQDKVEKKSKKESQQRLTGYEKFIMSEESVSDRKSVTSENKSEEDTVDIPEHFFKTEDESMNIQTPAKMKTPSGKRSSVAIKRTQRMSSVAENTPLRRSTRLHSSKQ